MIKSKLKRLYVRLRLMPKRNTFFQKYIGQPTTELLSWFIFPEFREKNRVIDLIVRNKFMVLVIAFFLFWTGGTFTLGKWSGLRQTQDQIDELEYRLDAKDDIIYNTNVLIEQKDSIIQKLQQKNSKKRSKQNVAPGLIVSKKQNIPDPFEKMLQEPNKYFNFDGKFSFADDSTSTELADKATYRENLETVIKRDCHLRHGDNLSKLPDHIFFCMIEEIERYQIPYTIFFRVIDHESGFRFIPNAQGSGALGYCQVMPVTFKNISRTLGLVKHDKINNIKVGAYLLRHNFNIYKKRGYGERDAWYHALVAYSGGNRKLAESELKYFQNNL